MAKIKILVGADFNGQNASNLADATAPNDAVTLQQLQAYIAGLRWKQNGVRVASVGNGTLATAFANGQTLDGVTLVTGDRILLKNQSSGAENGIYTVNAAGAPTRATDADSTAELENAAVFVAVGTANQDTAWVQTATVTTVGTTAQTWAPFGAGGSYTAGASGGLTLSGSAFSILLDTASGLVLGAGGIKVDPSVVTRKFSANCVATTNPQAFVHALGLDVDVTVVEVSTGKVVLADVVLTNTSSGTATIDFGGAPTAAQYRVFVTG